MSWRALGSLVFVACTSAAPAPVTDASLGDTGAADSDVIVCNAKCTKPTVCCQNQCVQTDNDPASCGTCGVHCSGDTPYCDTGKCVPKPCTIDASTCKNPLGCCGGSCCDGSQLCCKDRANGTPYCHTPNAVDPSCP